uniref:Uncharacterized protein n=1 Tax=Romanomermis culicivorax TaxID=13658 RepID=A0A915HTV0_ROMCU
MNDETPPSRQNTSRSSFDQRNAYARFPVNTDGDRKFNAYRGFGGDNEKNSYRGGFIRRENLPSTPERRDNRQEEYWDNGADRKSKNNFQRYSEKREQKSVIVDQSDPKGDEKPISDDQKFKSHDQKSDKEKMIESWDREIAEYEQKYTADIGDDKNWENDSDSPSINVARLPPSLLDESPPVTSSTGTSGAESGQFDDAAGGDVKTPAAEKSSSDNFSEAEISRDADLLDVSSLTTTAMNEIEQKMIEKMDENIKKAEAVLAFPVEPFDL